MQMRVLLTPIRQVTECASISPLPEFFIGSTQWFPPLQRSTGNYWEPERERAWEFRVFCKCVSTSSFFSKSFMRNTGLVCMSGEVHVLFLTAPHLPQHSQAHSTAGNYIIIVPVLYIKLGGEVCCLLPVDLWVLLLSLHSQSDPLATVFFFSSHLLPVIFFPYLSVILSLFFF